MKIKLCENYYSKYFYYFLININEDPMKMLVLALTENGGSRRDIVEFPAEIKRQRVPGRVLALETRD